MTTATQHITAEALYAMGDIGRCELIRGEIVQMTPAGAEHGDLTYELSRRIGNFVVEHDLGKVFAAETGFILTRNPDTVRAPDVAFVRKDRLPREPVRGYFPGAPDLVVEVISPGDRLSDVNEKVEQWLAGGATSVWVVDPPNRMIEISRAGGEVLRVRAPEVVKDDPVVPGFVLETATLFSR